MDERLTVLSGNGPNFMWMGLLLRKALLSSSSYDGVLGSAAISDIVLEKLYLLYIMHVFIHFQQTSLEQAL